MKPSTAIVIAGLILGVAILGSSAIDYYTFKAEPEIVYVDRDDVKELTI